MDLSLPADYAGLPSADLQALQQLQDAEIESGRSSLRQQRSQSRLRSQELLSSGGQSVLPFELQRYQEIDRPQLQQQFVQQETTLPARQQPVMVPHQQRLGVTDVYPPAECSQEDVVNNCDAFYMTLQPLHEQLGVTEKVPRVGGRELDLFMLYKNVCALGGCEKVIANKQWRDAAESFQYPETITSVSFVLRKAYTTFLWDYEQIYMHGKGSQRVVPPPLSQKEGSAPQPAAEQPASGSGSMSSGKTPKRRKTAGDNVATSFVGLMNGTPTQLVAAAKYPGSPDPFTVGSRGTVVVDARFDAGYFVTVRVGKQEFQGMLYYPPPAHTQQPPSAEKGSKDPFAPKPNKTPFNFFSVHARAKAKDNFPDMSQTDITKKVGEMWQKASEEEKAPYIAMSNQDKSRYQAELEAYNYRLAAEAASQTAGKAMNAVNAAQHAMTHQATARALSDD